MFYLASYDASLFGLCVVGVVESLGAARLFQCELFYTFRKVDGLA